MVSHMLTESSGRTRLRTRQMLTATKLSTARHHVTAVVHPRIYLCREYSVYASICGAGVESM